ncbi:kinase-like domain-containing protein [Baffinella frigidus]|nr:kinase-like domain-containing protein [Cryptophyta sp. CCMP2293]
MGNHCGVSRAAKTSEWQGAGAAAYLSDHATSAEQLAAIGVVDPAEQLAAIGVVDPAEQAKLLGRTSPQPNGATRQGSFASNAGGGGGEKRRDPPPYEAAASHRPYHAGQGSQAAAAPRPAASPGGSSLLTMYVHLEQAAFSSATVNMKHIIACGSFKNAYMGKMGETPICVLRHRGKGADAQVEAAKEIKILQTLPTHPNIVRCYGTFRYGKGEEPCIALELCERGLLSDWLSSKVQSGPVATPAQRFVVISQICAGMAVVANAGIVHRDLAAHNVLIACETPLVVKLTDFGMAIRLGEPRSAPIGDGSTNEVLAVRWAAPEILEAPSAWQAPWSEKSDVWAFGVCAWQVYADGEGTNGGS